MIKFKTNDVYFVAKDKVNYTIMELTVYTNYKKRITIKNGECLTKNTFESGNGANDGI